MQNHLHKVKSKTEIFVNTQTSGQKTFIDAICEKNLFSDCRPTLSVFQRKLELRSALQCCSLYSLYSQPYIPLKLTNGVLSTKRLQRHAGSWVGGINTGRLTDGSQRWKAAGCECLCGSSSSTLLNVIFKKRLGASVQVSLKADQGQVTLSQVEWYESYFSCHRDVLHCCWALQHYPCFKLNFRSTNVLSFVFICATLIWNWYDIICVAIL